MVCVIHLNRDAKNKDLPPCLLHSLVQCPLTFLESDMKPAHFIFNVTGETGQGVGGEEMERDVRLAFSLWYYPVKRWLFGHWHPVAPSDPETEKITSISRMVCLCSFKISVHLFGCASLSCST